MRAVQLKRREMALLGLLGVVLAVAGVLWLRGRSLPLVAAPAAPGPIEALPRIDLARLGQDRSETQVGRRDLFEFGAARGKETAPPPDTVFTPAPPPPPTPTPGPPVPVMPRLPPLNVKYVGSLERPPGLRVAVLLTDRNEILTGQAGEVVANRYRIVKIGLESVDLQEVGTGETRRIPLRGN
jgi:hypothetical protein